MYSLSDPIKLSDEFIEFHFDNELEGADHDEFKEELRKIYP